MPSYIISQFIVYVKWKCNIILQKCYWRIGGN